MTGRQSECDIAIVGGGLAGGLTALALARAHPGLSLRLIEAGEELGGNHRWSWFATDLPPAETALLEGFPQSQWNSGYDVRFPGLERTLPTPYRSLASGDFARYLHDNLPQGSIFTNTACTSVEETGVALASGERINAGTVIDARGFDPTTHLQGGWQVFMGRSFKLTKAHGLTRPTIMDASVTQHDGYRFVYVLPLTKDAVFIEDTYYNDSPDLDAEALRDRIARYCGDQGWNGTLLEEETGVLPVITGGQFSAYQASVATKGVAQIGAGAGFVHPLTSYTLPFAAQTALFVADHAHLPGAELARLLREKAQKHWQQTGYYRLLGSMLFGAAQPLERYRIFERFYRLSPKLIEGFYQGRSTLGQKARVLCGKPPVPLAGAIKAITTKRPPLLLPASASPNAVPAQKDYP